MRHALLKKTRYLLTLAFVFTAIVGAFAQGLPVSGRVVDENGQGLPGVTVVLKGTTIAAPTGADGNYQLSVPNGEGTLSFSFIGYKPQDFLTSSQF